MFRSLAGSFFKPCILTLDNFVFRLHYRVTVGLLLACAVALLWKITYGRPITCITSDDLNTVFLEDHCWYDGLFTVPSARSKQVGADVPAPGFDGGQDREYHNVHRWVVIAVLVQAAFFYLPRIIWRTFEGRLVQRLSWSMNDRDKVSSLKMFRKELVAGYLKFVSNGNVVYVGGHLLCEILNLVNVVVQLCLVSHVLQIQLPSVDLFVESRFDRRDASALSAFPLRTKCTYYKYARSGDVQKHDSACLMSVNGVMESIFIYQWIWFALLAVLSVLAVFYRMVMLILPQFRAHALAGKANLSDYDTVKKAVQQMSGGEWFVLYVLSKNIDPIDTRDILEGIVGELPYKDLRPAIIESRPEV